MRYTKRERKQIVTALTACKKHLWDGTGDMLGHRFICYALSDTGLVGANLARQVIMDRLFAAGGYGNVAKYLKHTQGLIDIDMRNPEVQAFRHRWVDHLIKEFSE